jgi:hypothetical protein
MKEFSILSEKNRVIEIEIEALRKLIRNSDRFDEIEGMVQDLSSSLFVSKTDVNMSEKEKILIRGLFGNAFT